MIGHIENANIRLGEAAAKFTIRPNECWPKPNSSPKEISGNLTEPNRWMAIAKPTMTWMEALYFSIECMRLCGLPNRVAAENSYFHLTAVLSCEYIPTLDYRAPPKSSPGIGGTMASLPKSISIQDLSGAVHKAVAGVKLPPAAGPYLYINPGLICGLIYIENLSQIAGAQQIATNISKQVAQHLGVTVAPVVQEGGVGAAAAAGAPLGPHHVILGYKAGPEFNVHF